MTRREPFTEKIVVEIRYARGMVYLDRCGSLMLALQDALGEPFRAPSLADIRYADLVSDFERIVVRYGPHAMSYTQVGPETAARCEKVSSDAWETVSRLLAVERQVTRCGVRLHYTWPFEDVEEARAKLASSQLVSPNEKWNALFGPPKYGSAIGFYEDARGGRKRIQVDVVQHEIEGEVPEGRLRFAPPAGVQLDVDCTYPSDGRERFALGPGQLREFIRSSWEDFKRLRKEVGQFLATEDEPNAAR